MSRNNRERDDEDDDSDDASGPVRLDKWLWAARFYRTRSIAKEAIESGHVRYQGDRAKVGRAVHIGAVVNLRQGFEEREVVVKALSGKRQGAPEAQQLYEETADSLRKREDARVLRRSGPMFDDARPERDQRRAGTRFKRGDG